MGKGEDLVALARSLAGSMYYTNSQWERMHPVESGGTDCSGLARYLYQRFGYDIGTWTGDESQYGTEVARGHYPYEIPWDSMKPGDLIFMTAKYWDNYRFDEYLCHVEIYCGGGTMIGHPGGWGPQEKWAQAWMEAYGCITWKVMRIFPDVPPDEWDLQMWTQYEGPNQKFRPIKNDDGTFTLQCVADDRCVDVKWGMTEPGTPVRNYTANGTASQKWNLVRKTGTYDPADIAPFEIVSALDPELCLDVCGASQFDGAGVCVYPRNGTKAQEWYILDEGDGTWVIMNNNWRKLVLDCKDGGR